MLIQGTVTVRLNVRSTPGGEKYPYTLGPGTKVIADMVERIPSFDGDWWHVISTNGNPVDKESWIAAGRGYEVYIEDIVMVEKEPPVEPPTEPPVDEDYFIHYDKDNNPLGRYELV